MPIPIVVLTGLLALLDPAPTPPADSATVPHRHAGRPFISPMGEPFPVRGQGDDTLVDWFQQADRNHDGSITVDEMRLDADRFFAVLDTNHDGEIDPDETTHYEQVIAPAHFSAGLRQANNAEPSSDGGRMGHHRGGGGHRGGKGHGGWGGGDPDEAAQGRARFGLLDLQEPVVSADADFNRGVSRDEFRKAAEVRFQALDVDHQGRLTLAVLETLKLPPPVRPKRDPDAAPDLDANADTGG